MRIAFILGSLEQGSNGVGDYTRRLAGELIRQGHEITAIALNDPFIKTSWKGIQKDEREEISVLRLADSLSWKVRIYEAEKWICNFNPEWLSLQFVNFSFHHKGLLFDFTKYIRKLSKQRKWHIMFHELWVEQPQFKFKLLGCVQKQQIKKIVEKLKPEAINTQSRIYQSQLYKMGFKVHYLPLFSNIPVIAGNNTKCLRSTENELSFVLFGSIYANGLVEQFANEVLDFCKTNFFIPILKILGRSGSEQDHWENVFTSLGIAVEILGEQAPGQVSIILANCDLGISTTPIEYAEKSGSVAAMLAHRLKIVVVSESLTIESESSNYPNGIFKYTIGNFASIYFDKMGIGFANEVSLVATNMINTLLSNL